MAGQINMDSEFGKIIFEYARNTECKSYLEIGTWNGEGSTNCFIQGLKERSDDYSFISLESCPDFHSQAVTFNKDYINEKIKLLHGRIVEEEELINSNLSLVEKSWLTGDEKNYTTCKNVWGNIPHRYDVVLLDGGEFSTLAEFNKLKDSVSVLLLDDTNSLKNKEVVEALNSSEDWEVEFNSNNRNGFAVYKREEKCLSLKS